MNNEMIKFCQRAARQALQDANSYGNTNNREQTMASSVRKAVENQYPGTWSCVCGQRFGRYVLGPVYFRSQIPNNSFSYVTKIKLHLMQY